MGNKKWTTEEDEVLKKIPKLTGETSLQLARHLARTPNAVNQRHSKLNHHVDEVSTDR